MKLAAALIALTGISSTSALVLPPDASAVSQWLTFLTPIALAVLAVTQMIGTRMAVQTKAAVAVVGETAKDIKIQTNSATGALLTGRLEDAEGMVTILQILADIRKTPADIEAVVVAEKKVAQRRALLHEHEISEAKVDANAATRAGTD